MSKKFPERLLPLTPAVLHVLLSLVDGERHGYAIAQEVEAMSEGRQAAAVIIQIVGWLLYFAALQSSLSG